MSNSQYTLSAVRQALGEFGISADVATAEKIIKYCEMLDLWSRRISLTTVRSPGEVLRRHFGESMLAGQVIDSNTFSVIDVGSGAGFPGIPVKLLRPQAHVCLLEPNAKKAAFLSEVIRSLQLRGIQVIRKRFEELELFVSGPVDCVTARAVGDFDSLLANAARVLRPNGQLVLWLGSVDASRISQSPLFTWSDPATVSSSSARVILSGRRL